VLDVINVTFSTICAGLDVINVTGLELLAEQGPVFELLSITSLDGDASAAIRFSTWLASPSYYPYYPIV
jgi:hypothetical protein